MRVRTRVAPSPTGEPHIGNFYSALLDYALAKKEGGQFVVRIEDTDRTRLVPGAEERFYQALDWLGLKEDESPRQGGPFGPYRQSERLSLYQKYAQELILKGAAYHCFCSAERLDKLRKEQQGKGLPPKYDRRCRELSKGEVAKRLGKNEAFVIRLKVADVGATEFNDLIRGKISFQNKLIDDQVLLKSDGFPTYHLAVVVDDHLMQITHVIRGEDWISSTPKHILIYQALGWELPQFLHNPLLRNPDGSKLSKRKNPTSMLWYREQGFLPEAVINYLTHLGWTHPEEKDIYSFGEFLDKFDLKDIKATAPVFDLQKLEWMNGKYIRQLGTDELSSKLNPSTPLRVGSKYLGRIVLLIQERMTKLSQFNELTSFFFEEEIKVDPKLLVQKGKTRQETVKALSGLLFLLSSLPLLEWRADRLEEISRKYCSQIGWKPKDLFMSIRVAMTGRTVSPPLFETMEVLGKERVSQRLTKVYDVSV